MNTAELNAAMQSKLETLGLPFETVQVFGRIRQNVHVKCCSAATAQRWVSVLSTIFPGGRATLTATSWPAAANKGTSLRPTMRAGYLVTMIGR